MESLLKALRFSLAALSVPDQAVGRLLSVPSSWISQSQLDAVTYTILCCLLSQGT